MLHNKGNTIPYYGEDFSGYATSLAFINRHSYTVQCHSIFLIFKINTLSENIRNYNNIRENLPK